MRGRSRHRRTPHAWRGPLLGAFEGQVVAGLCPDQAAVPRMNLRASAVRPSGGDGSTGKCAQPPASSCVCGTKSAVQPLVRFRESPEVHRRRSKRRRVRYPVCRRGRAVGRSAPPGVRRPPPRCSRRCCSGVRPCRSVHCDAAFDVQVDALQVHTGRVAFTPAVRLGPRRQAPAFGSEKPSRLRSCSLMRFASSSWSSRMMMRQAASTEVPWSTSSRARVASRS